MTNEYDYIAENYKQIAFDIEETKVKYRTTNDIVNIMAVTKTVSPDAINFAINCGIKLLGENKVQEYISKKDYYDKNADVHFIGHLQSNKIKYIIDNISVIQSVDSFNLAAEINKQAEKKNIVKDILIEVNIGSELSKSGVAYDNVKNLLHNISSLKNIKVNGLMTIPPVGGSEKYFSKMNELFVDIRNQNINNINMSILSMGMSADYILAIKYGSNLVRIGTKLFGARN